jgi:hypothetical protein
LRGRLTILPALAFAIASAAAPLAYAETPGGSSCIDTRQLQDWKSPSPNVIYYRVHQNDVYRFDLSTGSNQLKYSDVHLFSVHNAPSPWICTPIDWNLRVTDDHNTFTESLIVQSVTKLTPEEVAAIPPQYRP